MTQAGNRHLQARPYSRRPGDRLDCIQDHGLKLLSPEQRLRDPVGGLLTDRVTIRAKRCSDAALWAINGTGSGLFRQFLDE